MDPYLLYGGVSLVVVLLFVLILLQFFRKEKKDQPVFSLPTPPLDKGEWNRFAAEIMDIGFHLIETLDKSLYGLWPSQMNVYVHDMFEAFAELTLYPTGKFQVQFITLFPEGSVITVSGKKLLTPRFFSSSDWIYWASGPLISVWQEHMKQVEQRREKIGVSPVSPTREVYLDFVNLMKIHVRRAVKEDLVVPKTIEDWLALGFAKLDLFGNSHVLAMFQSAIHLEPKNSYLYWMAGKLAFFLSDFKSAVNYFQQTVKLNNRDKESWMLLGESLIFLRKEDEAYEAFEGAYRVFSQDNDFRMRLGLLGMKIGRLQEAKDYLEEVSNSGGASVSLFRALAKLYVRLSDFQAAKRYRRLARVFAREREDRSQLP